MRFPALGLQMHTITVGSNCKQYAIVNFRVKRDQWQWPNSGKEGSGAQPCSIWNSLYSCKHAGSCGTSRPYMNNCVVPTSGHCTHRRGWGDPYTFINNRPRVERGDGRPHPWWFNSVWNVYIIFCLRLGPLTFSNLFPNLNSKILWCLWSMFVKVLSKKVINW